MGILDFLKKKENKENQKESDKTTFEFHVAGVTFKNGRKTRQAILRAIKFKDSPFDKKLDITMDQYDYEGNPAIAVYVNGQQIGSVPKKHLKFLFSNFDNMIGVSDFKVIGGGDELSYGAVVTLSMKK